MKERQNSTTPIRSSSGITKLGNFRAVNFCKNGNFRNFTKSFCEQTIMARQQFHTINFQNEAKFRKFSNVKILSIKCNKFF